MFASKLTAVFAVFAAAATAVSAAPAAVFSKPKTDIVFRPHITSPKAGDVWPIGSNQTVTWDTSDIPEEARNQTGLILLGYLVGDDTDEHLGVNDPLAYNFPITAGSAQVTVPAVKTRDDYVIVLFGDSGNTSPKFTIKDSAATSLPGLPSLSLPSVASSVFPPAIPSVTTSVVSLTSPSASVSASAAASA
ncbi:hypothetical protein BN946_scf184884.g2 [Trametes cinnabarina]|uniref:Uncharacterized protein n=1 Tax=Pycnoporus cinnabarinus TaxID=5643 RepID=A0A060SBV0_PYCCI|nr:hypothetical protein BN946_scf184884.g2 [Trametes cinnabarina]